MSFSFFSTCRARVTSKLAKIRKTGLSSMSKMNDTAVTGTPANTHTRTAAWWPRAVMALPLPPKKIGWKSCGWTHCLQPLWPHRWTHTCFCLKNCKEPRRPVAQWGQVVPVQSGRIPSLVKFWLNQPCHASESLNGDAIAGTFFAKLGLHSCGTSVRDKGLLVRLLPGSGRPLHVCSALASFGRKPRRSILHGKLRHGNGKFKTALKKSERPTARSTWLQQAEDMQEINGRSKLEACKNGKKTASTDSFFFHIENFTLTASLKTFQKQEKTSACSAHLISCKDMCAGKKRRLNEGNNLFDRRSNYYAIPMEKSQGLAVPDQPWVFSMLSISCSRAASNASCSPTPGKSPTSSSLRRPGSDGFIGTLSDLSARERLEGIGESSSMTCFKGWHLSRLKTWTTFSCFTFTAASVAERRRGAFWIWLMSWPKRLRWRTVIVFGTCSPWKSLWSNSCDQTESACYPSGRAWFSGSALQALQMGLYSAAKMSFLSCPDVAMGCTAPWASQCLQHGNTRHCQWARWCACGQESRPYLPNLRRQRRKEQPCLGSPCVRCTMSL